METKNRFIKMVLLLVAAALFFPACGQSAQIAGQTQAAQTATSEQQIANRVGTGIALTDQARITDTPIPTSTPLPTATTTQTPQPSATPTAAKIASSTPDVNATIQLLRSEMGNNLDMDTYTVKNPTTTFQTQDKIYIHYWVHVNGKAEIPYRTLWIDPGGMTVLTEEGKMSPGDNESYFLGESEAPDGWTVGKYTVNFFYKNQLINTWTFMVK